MTMQQSEAYAAILRWQIEAGVDEAIGDIALDRRAEMVTPATKRADTAPAGSASAPARSVGDAAPARIDSVSTPVGDAVALAGDLARGAETIDALSTALAGFDGCGLKKTATNLCLSDGHPEARLMLIGEGPGREEDLQGKPFVGRAGQLLDKMLAAIGHDRANTYITNCVYWRPPGNRNPTPEETAICRPFLDRQIEIVAPDVIVMLGAVAAQNLTTHKEGITRMRGRWFDLEIGGRKIPAIATLHPAYLLRQPAQKKLSWRDLLSITKKLEETSL